MKLRVTIKNWYITDSQHYGGALMPPAVIEGEKRFLHGDCYGHPRFEDGTNIYTSHIVAINLPEVETRNTLYVLEGEQYQH